MNDTRSTEKTLREKVLVTGGAGYIGSWVVSRLLACGYQVTAYDALLFNQSSMLGVLGHPAFTFIKGDVRDKAALSTAMKGMDHVVHLAAIVGEDACKKDPASTRSVNLDGSRAVIRIAADQRVKRLIFFSTCSSYGIQDISQWAHEETPVNPVSLYAETKIEIELFLKESLKSSDTVYTIFRPATVHGPSARMRFDLIVNHFVRDAFLTNHLFVFGPDMWRPLMWVGEPGFAVQLALQADWGVIKNQIFNLGGSQSNYRKREIGEILKTKFLPQLAVEFGGTDRDIRSYRVDFSKIEKQLGFRLSKTLEGAIGDLLVLLKSGLIKDAHSPEYANA